MYKNLLPIGSVVLLKGGEKRLMICGRIQTRAGSDKVYDYSACLYPEGITGPAGMYFFDREAVETLGEVEVRDGKIVRKEQGRAPRPAGWKSAAGRAFSRPGSLDKPGGKSVYLSVIFACKRTC